MDFYISFDVDENSAIKNNTKVFSLIILIIHYLFATLDDASKIIASFFH